MNKEALKRSFRITKRKKWPIVLAVIILLLFPAIAYGIGYMSGIVCNAMFGYLFPFEKIPETFGLVAALGCVFSIGSFSGSKN